MELDKPGYYTTQNVEETAFDPDKYDNRWYSVKFEGDAATVLWLAKEEPEEHRKYYGHFEKTKSGKALRFKRDKEPEEPGQSERPKAQWQPRDDDSIKAQFAIKAAIQFLNGQKDAGVEDIEPLARDLFVMVERVKQGLEEKDTVYDPDTTPIGLDLSEEEI